MTNIFYEAGHIFHHYLECSIPEEEWKCMTVAESLTIANDVAALLDDKISSEEFGKKYRLPRS